ncbi:symplekin [Pelomyxa schiedti]|nr:symplekin [Pelomyxa schiedti]
MGVGVVDQVGAARGQMRGLLDQFKSWAAPTPQSQSQPQAQAQMAGLVTPFTNSNQSSPLVASECGRLAVLTKAFDLLLNSPSEPSSFLNNFSTMAVLVNDTFNEILQFTSDPAPAVRAAVIVMFLHIVDDNPTVVVSRIFLAVANLWPKSLEILLKPPSEGPADPHALWNNINTLKTLCITRSLFLPECARVNSIRLMESVILCGTNSENVNDGTFSLEKIPATHHVLSAASVNKDAMEVFDLLIQMANKIQTSTHAIVIGRILLDLGKQRQSLLSQVLQAVKSIISLSNSFTAQLHSIHYTLKLCLLSALRTNTQTVTVNMPLFTELLTELGAKDLLNEHLENVNELAMKADSPPLTPPPSQQISGPNTPPTQPLQSSAAPVALSQSPPPQLLPQPPLQPPMAPTQYPPHPYALILEQRLPGISQLSASSVVDIALENMWRIEAASTPPPFYGSLPESLDQMLLHISQVASSNPPPEVTSRKRRDPRLARLEQTELPPLSMQIPLPLSAMQTPQMQMPPLQIQGQIPLPMQPPLNQPDYSMTPSAQPQQYPSYTQQVQLVQTAPEPQQAVPAQGSLSSNDMVEMSNSAIQRILMAEENAAIAGALDLRSSLIAKLVSFQYQNSDNIPQIISFILQDLTARRPLALKLMYAIAAREIKSNNGGILYAEFCKQLLIGAAQTLQVSHKILSSIFIQAPWVPDEVLAILYLWSENQQNLSALHIVKEWAAYLPPLRSRCLSHVLKFVTSKDNKMSTAATDIITNYLYKVPSASAQIIEFSNNLLGPIYCKPEEKIKKEMMEITLDNADITFQEQKEKLSPEEVSSRLAFYFKLVAKDFTLLTKLFEVYSLCDKQTQKVMHSLAPPLVAVMPKEDPTFLQILDGLAPGCNVEVLVLLFLHLMTDQTKPPPKLVDAVKRVHVALSNDTRFLVSIVAGLTKEEIQEYLPKYLGLKPNVLLAMINRILHTPSSPLDPRSFLIMLHTVPTAYVKSAIEPIRICLEQGNIYTQDVLAAVLQHLVDEIPVPPLFMRTTIWVVQKHRKLMSFVMNQLLSTLIRKQVWLDRILWEGFVNVVKISKPFSFPIILQLPPAQLAVLLHNNADLLGSLRTYCHSTQPKMPPHVSKVLEHPESFLPSSASPPASSSPSSPSPPPTTTQQPPNNTPAPSPKDKPTPTHPQQH